MKQERFALIIRHSAKAMSLDDQTQADTKQAGQPEQAGLNQCQLIAHKLCSVHAQLMLAIRFLCNVCNLF